MASNPKTIYTSEEYLALERSCETKHEYYDGEIFAMGGASRYHVMVVTNLVGELHTQLKEGPCQVYSADLRVKVSPTGLYTYPDVIVLCEEPQFSDEQKDTLVNPALIIEVLSESTENYDRGRKFEQYRTIDSFVEYLLIAQDRPHVEHHTRQADGSWLLIRNQQSGRYDSIEISAVHTSDG